MSIEPTKYGIKQEIWDKIISTMCTNSGVQAVILFGSRAKGNFRNGSDIDLCVKGPILSERDIRLLSSALDDLNLPWEIDLLSYEDIRDPAVIDHIDRVGIELYGRS